MLLSSFDVLRLSTILYSFHEREHPEDGLTLGRSIGILEEVAFNIIKEAVIYLPEDVKDALQKAFSLESSEIGKTQLKTILDNIALAEKLQSPMCQDTGTLTFYIKAGADSKNLDQLENALVNATRRATIEVPLRPNAVNPLNQKNSGDNTGRFTPTIHWEIVSGDDLEITVLAKGGGSENVSSLEMISPGEGLKGLKRFVIDTIIKAGALPCPPTIVGVAFGGSADAAILLAKKALLRPLGEKNTDAEIANLEQEIFDAANMTGIGPMGLGGKTTVLGVHVDYAFRHPASYPVAVVLNCWASRRTSALIHAGERVEYLSRNKKGEK
jgi:fumarate hydratase subunit alpha